MLLLLRGLLMSRAGLFAMAALAAVSWIKMHDYNLRKDERSRVVATMEKATNEAVSQAGSAGRKSADDKSGGVLNPHYRD